MPVSMKVVKVGKAKAKAKAVAKVAPVLKEPAPQRRTEAPRQMDVGVDNVENAQAEGRGRVEDIVLNDGTKATICDSDRRAYKVAVNSSEVS